MGGRTKQLGGGIVQGCQSKTLTKMNIRMADLWKYCAEVDILHLAPL